MDPAERKRRDDRFIVAKNDLEGKFKDLVNQFMSDSSDGKNATEFAAQYLAEKAGLKLSERVVIDDPPTSQGLEMEADLAAFLVEQLPMA